MRDAEIQQVPFNELNTNDLGTPVVSMMEAMMKLRAGKKPV